MSPTQRLGLSTIDGHLMDGLKFCLKVYKLFDQVRGEPDGIAKLRLRPILMTSFAFILGCVPLWRASGSGAVSRQVMGTAVIGGMTAASAIAIFIIPALFYMIERLGGASVEGVKSKLSGAAGMPPASTDHAD